MASPGKETTHPPENSGSWNVSGGLRARRGLPQVSRLLGGNQGQVLTRALNPDSPAQPGSPPAVQKRHLLQAWAARKVGQTPRLEAHLDSRQRYGTCTLMLTSGPGETQPHPASVWPYLACPTSLPDCTRGSPQVIASAQGGGSQALGTSSDSTAAAPTLRGPRLAGPVLQRPSRSRCPP